MAEDHDWLGPASERASARTKCRGPRLIVNGRVQQLTVGHERTSFKMSVKFIRNRLNGYTRLRNSFRPQREAPAEVPDGQNRLGVHGLQPKDQ